MRRVLFLVVALVCVVSLSAAERKRVNNIVYHAENEYAEKMCRVDVSYEEGVKDRPVIVWFHGGGLTGGGKEIPAATLRDGAVVVGVGYRFSPHVKVKQIIDDAARAVAWVYNNVEQYGGSREKIYIAGHSAGGYLVSMVSLDKSYLAKYCLDTNILAGVIPFSGQAITHFEERRVRGISDKQPIVDDMAPMYHVRADAPPMLILSGDRELEMLGRYEENAYLWRMMRLVGHKDVTLYELDGYGHNMCEPAYPLMLKFIREHESKRNE